MARLEGQSVIIRPFRADELDLMLRGRTQLGREALPGGVPDREQLRDRIAQSGELRDGRIDLAIQVEESLVGDIQTYLPSDRLLPPAVFEMGVALYDPARRGKGVGTEAVRLLVGWLFERGAERVQGAAAMTNAPMRRVFEKLGFEVVDTIDVEGVPEHLYAVSRPDWHRRSGSTE
jgi:RimJ/RimL family protein N-acetyltransferase